MTDVTGYTKAGADAAFATAAQLAGKVDSSALATVATSGAYGDLTGQPSIPAAQVQTDWTASTGMGAILNKPTLGTAAAQDVTAFATAGQGAKADTAIQPAALTGYVPTTRLINGKPLSGDLTLTAADVGALTQATADGRYATTAQGTKADTAVQPAALTPYAQTANVVPNTRTVNGKALSANVTLAASDVGAATTAQGAKADTAIQPATLATVATSGSYADLSSKPSISALTGTMTLAQLVPGARFTILYSTTTNGGAGGWTYNGAYITTRPTARADVFMSAIDYTGTTAGTGPSFAVAGDSYDVKTA